MRFLISFILILVSCSTPQKPTKNKHSIDGISKNIIPPKAIFLPLSGPAITKYIPQYKRYKVGGFPTLQFGLERTELSMEDPGFRHYPILVRNGEEIRFESEEYFGHSWDLVVSDNNGARVFGVLEHDIEGPAHELLLVASDDGGLNWYHAATVKKPNYLARIKSLGFSKEGEGTLVIRLADYGGVPPGDYIYSSSDWGRTWSEPIFRTDIMSPAERIE